MYLRANWLAMVASRAQQGSRTVMSTAMKTAAAAAESTKKAGKKSGGLMIAAPVSPELKKFVGVSEISRPEAVKKIWEHIKANNLQNPANKREIRCDEKLKSIFGRKENVTMFEISKLISPHFIKK